jgi:hypothetical protein
MGSGYEVPPYLTLIRGGGEWSPSGSCRFNTREIVQVPIGYEAGWTPEPVWASVNSRTPVAHAVALPAELSWLLILKIKSNNFPVMEMQCVSY